MAFLFKLTANLPKSVGSVRARNAFTCEREHGFGIFLADGQERREIMEEATREALEELAWHLAYYNPKEILQEYREYTRCWNLKRKKLKNPINSRTGRPLAPSTIRTYQSELRGLKDCVDDYKEAIRFFASLGIFKGQKQVELAKGKVVSLMQYRSLKEVEQIKENIEKYREFFSTLEEGD